MRKDDRFELALLELARVTTLPYDAETNLPPRIDWQTARLQYDRMAEAGYLRLQRSSCYETHPTRYSVQGLTAAGIERLDALRGRTLLGRLRGLIPCLAEAIIARFLSFGLP